MDLLGLKGPKPVIIFGNLLDLLFVSKPDLEVQRMKQFGKIYGIFEGSKPLIQVAEPELIKQILVKDFRLFNTKVRITNIGHPVIERMLVSVRGDTWRRTRAAVSPAFAIGRMRRQYAQIRHCVGEHLVQRMQSYADNCAPVDVKRMYGCFTLSTMTWCAFGARTDPYRDSGHPFVANAWPVFKLPLWKLLALQVLPGVVLRAFRIRSLFDEKCIANITQTILTIMRAKETAGDKSDDFINVVMNSKLDPNEELPDDNNPDDEENLVMRSKTNDSNVSKKSLTEEEIVAQGFIFFTAAFDQMANLLSFITYELALKPEAQDRLYEEIAGAHCFP
ncbi:unnamed protein product [Medioppia subpectinata]|uniref:Cytochrome P450 n=1 Tax=Medioppia subpectinata TaxID=1979941 RepID=A0A7R9KYP5_9ACAR|nr:unnamed protein product [Medioppia subpectinata]CAG2112341.1 unnamed protein product [Medioppia subpectinata]